MRNRTTTNDGVYRVLVYSMIEQSRVDHVDGPDASPRLGVVRAEEHLAEENLLIVLLSHDDDVPTLGSRGTVQRTESVRPIMCDSLVLYAAHVYRVHSRLD